MKRKVSVFLIAIIYFTLTFAAAQTPDYSRLDPKPYDPETEPNIDLSLLNLEIHVGGPLELERGFFLHSAEYGKNLLFKPENSDLAVSSNIEILKDITTGAGPKLNMFTIGYTGWNAGQIEFEIQNNLWIVAEPDKDLIFGTDASSKWLNAFINLDIDSSDFVPHLANC